VTHHQFIDETESGDEHVQWKWDLSVVGEDYRPSDLSDELAEQTKLTFADERRRGSAYYISAPPAK
jgi:hypothetical protein